MFIRRSCAAISDVWSFFLSGKLFERNWALDRGRIFCSCLLLFTLEDQFAGCMDLGNQGGTGDCFFGRLVLCLETGRKRIEGTSAVRLRENVVI